MTLAVYVLRQHKTAVLGHVSWQPHEVASCDDDALAFTLLTLTDEGQITDRDRVGVLERSPDGGKGRWLISPYAKGRSDA